MQNLIIVIGMGELGSVFARGFLKLGFPVQGITRGISMQSMAEIHPSPKAVLIAVGEADIHETLKNCPKQWQNNLILIQNELLPRDWQTIQVVDPTVVSVWFEKKPGMDSKVVLPSPVFGQHSQLIFDALATLNLPCVQLDSTQALNYELVRKNCYILTTNIAGLKVGGNVTNLASEHEEVMLEVVKDVLTIQDWLTNTTNDREALIKGMLKAFKGDPEHNCMGRSAPARLARALNYAKQGQLAVPTLKEIATLKA